MAAAGNLYAKFLEQAFAGAINLTTDTIKLALLKTTYTPTLSGNEFWSDVSTHETSGTGYTTGGVALATKTVTLTKASTWATSRAATTTYTFGAVVRPATANGYLYRAVIAGKSGSALPTYPTVPGETVTDGTVTWSTLGGDALVFKTSTAQWTTATFTASYGVLYVTTGTATTSTLISLQTFAAKQAPAAQTYQVLPDSSLGWFFFSPPS